MGDVGGGGDLKINHLTFFCSLEQLLRGKNVVFWWGREGKTGGDSKRKWREFGRKKNVRDLFLILF
jgi:hypothetical protein